MFYPSLLILVLEIIPLDLTDWISRTSLQLMIGMNFTFIDYLMTHHSFLCCDNNSSMIPSRFSHISIVFIQK